MDDNYQFDEDDVIIDDEISNDDGFIDGFDGFDPEGDEYSDELADEED